MNRDEDRTAYTHEQLLTEGQISGEDSKEIKRHRRTHNRLSFAYQLTFVKLFGRFPAQQPLEITREVLVFVSTQLGVAAVAIEDYARRRETVAEHQERIRQYLGLRRFSEAA